MGSFVTVYNYVGFRLLAPPFGLSQTVVASIFLVYLVGTVSSAAVGSLAGRIGRRRVLWAMILLMLAGLALTLADTLPLLVAGMAVFTFGFFGAHSVVSSWVGIRAMAGQGAGLRPLSVLLLSGLQPGGLPGRPVLDRPGLAGRRRHGRRAAGRRLPDLPAPRPAGADRPNGSHQSRATLTGELAPPSTKGRHGPICRRD